MPTVKNGDATIYYEVHGKGFPILTYAPAGLRSSIEIWNQPSAPIHPVKEWSESYSVIVMDQRNAGRSRAPITAKDGWHSFVVRSRRRARPRRSQTLPPVRPVHRRGHDIRNAEVAVAAHRVRRDRAAQRTRGPDETGTQRELRVMGEDAQGPSRSHRAGARRLLSEHVRAGLRLQRRPRVRGELPDAVPPARGQRRRAPASRLGRDREADAQRGVHTPSGRQARRWKPRKDGSRQFLAKHTPGVSCALTTKAGIPDCFVTVFSQCNSFTKGDRNANHQERRRDDLLRRARQRLPHLHLRAGGSQVDDRRVEPAHPRP